MGLSLLTTNSIQALNKNPYLSLQTPILMTYAELESQVQQLIARNEVESAIDLLSQFFNSHAVLSDIILQSGMYHSLVKDHRNGLLEYQELQRALNQLRLNILDFVRRERENHPGANLKVNERDKKEKMVRRYRNAVARTSVLWLLWKDQDENGLTISEIQRALKIKTRKNIVETIRELEEGNYVDRQKKERSIYWSLSEKGIQLASDFEGTLLFQLSEK